MLYNRILLALLCISTIFLTLYIPSLLGLSSNVRSSDYAILIKIEGYTSLIDIPVQEYISRTLNVAENRGAPLLIFLDTYGGYLDPALNIAKLLLESKVPTIVYVKDKAYSAGTLIALASHVLVMSRTGVIGATQPITVNPVTGEIVFLNESKVVNPIVKTLEVCANIRNRNISLVRRFVYENLVLTGEEAVKFGVANYVAESLDEVLHVIHGIELNVSGTIWKLEAVKYIEVNPDVDIYAMIFLRNSVVNSILLFIGIFGTLILITSGRIELLPITVLLLLLALVGGDISGRIISFLLIALGSILLFVELFVTPGFGVLGVSGLVALFTGILLSPLPTASYTVNVMVIWRTLMILTISLGSLFLFILYKSIKALKSPKLVAYVPEERIVGKAIDKLMPGSKGYVMINGELWIAESNEIIEPGEEVEVIERKGLIVKVKKRYKNQ
ncbi:MAG: NfeD family protein [Ignisphaera sp.]